MAMQQKDRTLANVIADALDAKGYSNRQFGHVMNVSKTAVADWRHGKRPDAIRIDRIAQLLDLDPDATWELYREATRAEDAGTHSREEVVSLLARCAAVTRRRSSVCAPGVAVA